MQFRKQNWPMTHLARKNIPKSRERVIKCFVVYRSIQILDEDIPYTRFPQRGVPLRPHDADGLASDYIKVHSIQGPLSCSTKSKKKTGNFILKKASETPIGNSPLNTFSLTTLQIQRAFSQDNLELERYMAYVCADIHNDISAL